MTRIIKTLNNDYLQLNSYLFHDYVFFDHKNLRRDHFPVDMNLDNYSIQSSIFALWYFIYA